jgi:flagellar protein FlbD
MIELYKLDNSKIIIDIDQIESIEQNLDTVVTLSNGNKIIVKEDAKNIIEKIIISKFEKHKIKNEKVLAI